MTLLNWTLTNIGIGISLIALLFGLFQYFNKRGGSKKKIVLKSLSWGLFMSVGFFIVGLRYWIEDPGDSKKLAENKPKPRSSLEEVRQPIKEKDKVTESNFIPSVDTATNNEITKPERDFYEVILVLPSIMSGADIFVDDKPAMIVDQTLTIVTIRVEEKETSHLITVKKDDYPPCSKELMIRQNKLRLQPCQ